MGVLQVPQDSAHDVGGSDRLEPAAIQARIAADGVCDERRGFVEADGLSVVKGIDELTGGIDDEMTGQADALHLQPCSPPDFHPEDGQ